VVRLSPTALIDRRAEAIDKDIAIQGLYQKADRSIVERVSAHILVRYGGNEYERHAVTLLTQMVLELHTVHRCQTNVSNHTPGTVK
jgi:hypothetical protein